MTTPQRRTMTDKTANLADDKTAGQSPEELSLSETGRNGRKSYRFTMDSENEAKNSEKVAKKAPKRASKRAS